MWAFMHDYPFYLLERQQKILEGKWVESDPLDDAIAQVGPGAGVPKASTLPLPRVPASP
jgi:hypothetical protein